MSLRFFTVAALTVVASITAASDAPLHFRALRANVPGTTKLKAFGSRSAQQAATNPHAVKYDAALADIARHLNRMGGENPLQDLHNLHPAARFAQFAGNASPSVLIDAVTRGDPQALKTALLALGLQRAASFSNDVGGWLPVTQLEAATRLSEVHAIRAAMPRTRTGAVTSQGDFVQHSDTVRSANTLDGTGVSVGILSDSYDCYATYAKSGPQASGANGYANNGFTADAAADIATGDLPASVDVLSEAPCEEYGHPLELPFTDEGRAMMQIVHDVAPGAALSFYSAATTEADFASGIEALASAGAKIIADDIGYPDEPFFQDGIVAQAIDTVAADGVAYFSAAGNDGSLAYDNTAPNFAYLSSSAPNSGEHLLNFDQTPGGTAAYSLPVTIPALVPGEYVSIVVAWDQPYVTGAPASGGSTSSIDLCLTGVTTTDTVTDDDLNTLGSGCTGGSTIGQDAVQIIVVGNPANASGNSSATTIGIQVGLVSGTTPGLIKVAVEDDGAGSTINSYATNTATLQGHPSATGAAAVGAAFYFETPACDTTPVQLEAYSSEGGAPTLFTAAGVRQTAVVRQKPDFVAPDGGNDTFLGFTLASDGVTGGKLNTSITQCQNNPSYPNFFGTSAATPHAASIAALMLQANSALTPAEIFQYLSSTAIATAAPDSNGATSANLNYFVGAGFVQADAAFAMVPPTVPAAPTLALGASSITVGASTTITWSSANTTSCTASGSWSGTLATSGTQTVTPTGAGADTYTLICSNAAGASPATSVTLTVNAPASHGGGALDWQTLLGLAALVVWARVAWARAQQLARDRRA